MKKTICLAILMLSSVLGLTGAASTVAVPPSSTQGQPVSDLAKVLSSFEKTALVDQINTVRDKYGQTISILIIPNLSGETVEEYSLKAATKLGIDSGQSKSLLILVALREKKIRMEIGGGDRNLVSAAAAQNIIDQKISPLFASQEYASGLGYGITNLNNIFEADKQMQGKTVTQNSAPSLKDLLSGGAAMIVSMFLIAVVFQIMAVRLREEAAAYKPGRDL